MGFFTTTTISGLSDEAPARPHVPSWATTRTPFTVTRLGSTCGAVAAGSHHPQLSADGLSGSQVFDISLAKSGPEFIVPPADEIEIAVQHKRLQSCHLLRPNVRGLCAPIFTAVQPFSLWEAVTMATDGKLSANWAK